MSDADFRHDLRNEVFYRDVLKLLKCFCRGQTHPFNRLVLYFEVSNRRTHDVEVAIRAWIDRRNGAAVIIQEQEPDTRSEVVGFDWQSPQIELQGAER